ncbi:hypothetical protein ABZS71_05930 [Streptomyces sp. NPDC005393]|uniref:hypothetical protein n=1 Tax=Streptomyces sp. NPDC005393 TaxID=3157041 RepID=UPI0033A82A39
MFQICTPVLGRATEEAWRAALEHAAGCRDCWASDEACKTGSTLLDAYRRARRESGRAFQQPGGWKR